MGCESNKLWVFLFLLMNATYMQHFVVGEPQVPCLFIFGDSLSDSGNNNDLITDAKVNYMPYGIDFPAGPTGRFTNGRTSVDIITQLLGFDNFIPPYANTDGSDITLGVNYASGAAGIRNETGKHLGDDVSLELQVRHHTDIVDQIAKKLGTDKVQQHLNKCLYYVNIGSNDYINNYFSREHYSSSQKYTPDQFAAVLVQQLAISLKALHVLGARKFSLFGLNKLGCIPHEITIHGKNNSVCVEEESDAAQLFNDKLKKLVTRFNKELSDAKFIYINSAVIKYGNYELPDIVKCCKVGSNGQCVRGEEPCKGRNLHPFFDAFHPSEIVNQFTARSAYNAPIPSYAYPMDISHLVNL